jgi:hypothetical protein
MALKSKAGGKDGGEEDGDLFPPVREVVTKLKQGPMNFGVYLTGDKDKPVVLAAHKRKNPEALGKLAKKQAGTPKGACGTLTLEEGGMLTFACAEDDAPASLRKRIKGMLKVEGFAKFKVRILLPGGAELGGGDDEDEGEEAGNEANTPLKGAEDGGAEMAADPMVALREKVQAEFDALVAQVEAVADQLPPGVARKIEGLRTMFATEIERDPRKGAGIVQLLRKTIDAAGIAGDGADDAAAAAAAEAAEREARRAAARAARAGGLADLEKGIDALLAAYS